MKSTGPLVVLCIALAAGAQAAQYVASSGSVGMDVPSSVSVNVTTFNSSLGTLTGVNLSLVNASENATMRLVNGAGHSDETWNIVLNNGIISFTDGSHATNVIWDNDGNALTTSFITIETAFGNATTPISPSTPFGSANQTYLADLSGYVGDGIGFVSGMTVDFYGSYGVNGLIGGDGYFVDTFTGSADWKVTYTYTAIPEPAAASLLLLGATAVGLRRRRYKKTA